MEEQCFDKVQPVRQPQVELSDYGSSVYEHYSDVQTVDKRIRCLDSSENLQDSAKENFYDRNRVRIIEEKLKQSNTMVKSFDEDHDDDMLLSDLKEVLPGEEFLTADDEIIIQDVLNDLEKLPNKAKEDYIEGKTFPESDEDKLSALNITLTPAPQLPWPTFYDKKDEVSSSVPTENVSDNRDDASHKKTHGIMGVPPLSISDGNVKRNLSAEKDPDSSTVNPSVPEMPLDASLHSQINLSTDNLTRDGTINITVKSDRSIGDPALNGTAKECVREVIKKVNNHDIEECSPRKRLKLTNRVKEACRSRKQVKEEVIARKGLEVTNIVKEECNPTKVTYQVIDEGTIRNKPMLVSSDGFSYTAKRPQKNGKTNWRCSNRRKGLMCYASVTQTDDVFSRGVTQHIHSADPNMEKIVRMKRDIKRDAARDDHVPAGQLVKVKLGEVYNNENLNLPRAATLIRTVNRARQKLRPKKNLS